MYVYMLDNKIFKFKFWKEKVKDTKLMPMEMIPGHKLPGGCVSLSPHKKWLASGGGGGRIILKVMGSHVSYFSLVLSSHICFIKYIYNYIYIYIRLLY